MAMRIRRTKPIAEVPSAHDGAVVDITPMRRRHVRSVVAIENQIFPRPWSPALYYSELTMPATRLYYVALVEGVVVGYAGAMLVVGEGHITTIGVDPAWQRRKIGMALLHRLAADAVARGAVSLTLEVRVTNHGAQELYRAFGFAPAGIRKNYYAEVNEDGLVMMAEDVNTSAYAERLERLGQRLTATSRSQTGELADDEASEDSP